MTQRGRKAIFFLDSSGGLYVIAEEARLSGLVQIGHVWIIMNGFVRAKINSLENFGL